MLSADGNFQCTRPPRNGYFQGHLQSSFTTRSHISSKDNFSVIPVPDSLIGNTPPFLPSGRPPGISPNRNSHGLTRRQIRFHYINQSPCTAREDRGQEDRKRVVKGKSVSDGLDIGGRRYLKKKIAKHIKIIDT